MALTPSTATTLLGRSISCQNCRQNALRSIISSLGGGQLQPPTPHQRRAFSKSASPRHQSHRALSGSDHPLNKINDLDDVSMIDEAFANRFRSRVYRFRGQKGVAQGLQEKGEGGEVVAGRDEAVVGDAGVDIEQPAASDPAEVGAAATEIKAERALPDAEGEVPWYLQPSSLPTPLSTGNPEIQPHGQHTSENPMALRQRIPDLPIQPPPILEPLLQNISIDQGMDDLTLLDLRNLDPPPALGSNLIMIFGTARSEKHLHVSADRLCRWIRTNYTNLTPYADGLLGRNELKLKLKRRAKRSKLISAVGAQRTSPSSVGEEGEVDEGIRTSWICVNVGRVEGGELPEQRQQREERLAKVVGFGTEETGCSVVVQLMTEEKREEIGLERLWRGILKASEKERAARAAKEQDGEVVDGEVVGEDAAAAGDEERIDGMGERVGVAG